MSTPIAPWADDVVRGIADVLGETDGGLTGSQIGQLLQVARVPDLAPTLTKRHRLYEALSARQAHDAASNCVVAFVTAAMAPSRYRDDPGLFSRRQDALNEVMVYAGVRVNDAGKVGHGAAATTLSEAAQHVGALRAELRRRGTHPAVLASCTEEVLVKDWFHASLEATKGLAQRVRDMTGLDADGAELARAALAPGADGPVVAINAMATKTDRAEQTGFANLVLGIFGMYRNPVAHDPRSRRQVSDDALLELLTQLSAVHRRLDAATVQHSATGGS